jgi:TonB family protein
MAVLLSFVWRKHTNAPHPQQRALINYNSTKICSGAYDKNLDFSTLHESHFEVTTQDGCFSGWVHVPSSWRDWHSEPTGEAKDTWLAFWFPNDVNGTPPAFVNERTGYNKPVHEPFRLQGHGTFVFYTNQPTPSIPAENPTSSPGPYDPVPDKDGVYKPGNGVVSPVIISKVESEYSEGARRMHWTGTVVATGVVQEDGTITQIRIPESPGMGLDDKVIEALRKWKFKPGELDGRPVPVRVEIALRFQKL